MAYAIWQHDFTDDEGNLLTGPVPIRVVPEFGTELPQLYSDWLGVSALGNGFVNDGGRVAFHVAGGVYKITAAPAGMTPRVLRHVGIGLAGGTDLQLMTPAGAWDSVPTYTVGQWVRHGGYAFASRIDGNENNEPDDTTPGDTTEWMFLGDLSLINPDDAVTSSTVSEIAQLTQAEYDGLGSPDPATLYIIIEE